MSTLWTDVRYGVRMILKTPAFSAIAIIVLGVGIGANTAIFSVVDGVLLRPLEYPEADELVTLRTHFMSEEVFGLSELQLLLFENQSKELEEVGGIFTSTVTLGGSDRPERVSVTWVTSDLLRALGVAPLIGRPFRPEDEVVDAEAVAILSHGMWSQRFGADPDIIGQQIWISDQPVTIVGVMPAGFHHPIDNFGTQQAALWMVNAIDRSDPSPGNHYLTVVGRMAPGSSVENVAAEARRFMAQINEERPDIYLGASAEEIWIGVEPLLGAVVGEVRPALLVLLAAVAAVLLIACVNVANLLLVRGEVRRREMAVRAALGAGRWQIVRQVLIESLVLATMGGVLGVFIAHWGTDLLLAMTPDDLPRAQGVTIDGRVLAFTSLICLVAAALFGTGPALQSTRLDVSRTLKQEGRGSTFGRGRLILRKGLVISEIALAVALVLCAGLLTRSFSELRRVDPGFEVNNLLTFRISLPSSTYPDANDVEAFFDRLVAGVGALPGVVSVGAVNNAPLAGRAGDTIFDIEGGPTLSELGFSNAAAENRHSDMRWVSPGYFEAMGIQVVGGRSLRETDNIDSPGVMLINQTMAERLWPDQDPIGQRMRLYTNPGQSGPWLEIIGIVSDSKLLELWEEPRTEMFQPAAQVGNTWPFLVRTRTLVVRTSSEPMGVAGTLPDVVASIDDSLPISDIQPMRSLVTANIAQPRFNSLMMGLFAGIALVLASIGIYGVMSYAVAQRTQELGVRLALGAQGRDVLRLVIRQGMLLAGLGLVIGVVIALVVSRALASLLYAIAPTDPLTYGLVIVFLALVALLANYIPARRATRVDPKVALEQQ